MESSELKDPRAYNRLTPILQKINSEVVALKEDQKRRAVRVMNQIVSHVVQQLRSVNQTFDAVYKDTRWVGSYFDGLRVCEPTEFDVNIVLQFPFHEKCLIEKSDPGFVRVCAEPDKMYAVQPQSQRWNNRTVDWTLKQFIDGGGYIRRDKVLAWWQSMFTKAVSPSDFVNLDGLFYLVTWRSSGPAITLHIVSQEGPLMVMDIDLVPVLRFTNGQASSPSQVFDAWLQQQGCLYPPKEWYIVPKPLKQDGTQRLWRLSFAHQEKVMMCGKDHLKPVNRLLKRLRDNNDWKPLSSYFIKTVVLHEAGRDYNFHRSSLGYLLVFIEKSDPGFVRVCAEPDKMYAVQPQSQRWNNRTVDWTLKQFIDGGGYIRRDKVLAWWQSMFTKAVSPSDFVNLDGLFYLVTWRSSGPAITLHIVSQEGPLMVMDIDLVPVLRFTNGQASSPSQVFDAWLQQQGCLYPPKEWYIVPKPLKQDGTQRLWRLSFAHQEKVMMCGKDHLKPVNRLLKRLRDNNDWKPLSSYFIKTVVLHEAGRDYNFHRSSLGYLLVFFMSKLKDRLYYQRLPFYWDPDMNLFAQIPSVTQSNMYGSLNRILKKIHSLLDDERELEEYMRSLFIGGVGTTRSTRASQDFGGRVSSPGAGAGRRAGGSMAQVQQQPESSNIGFGTLLLGGAAVGVGALALASMLLPRNRNN